MSYGKRAFKPAVRWTTIDWWLICRDSDPFSVGYHTFPEPMIVNPYNLVGLTTVTVCGAPGEDL